MEAACVVLRVAWFPVVSPARRSRHADANGSPASGEVCVIA